MLDASGSEPATSYCHLVGSRMNLMKIGTEKRCSFCGLYGISFLPLFWNTLGGMAHAQLLRLLNAYLLSLVHTEQLARTEIFSGKKLRHFIQKQNI